MRMAGAAAGMVSAAILLAPGCRGTDSEKAAAGEPLRRANFRSLAALDFLATCPGSARRPETRAAAARYEELKRLALDKDAGQALWLGENDWTAISRHDDRAPCRAGDRAYSEALAGFTGALDTLAGRIANYSGETQ